MISSRLLVTHCTNAFIAQNILTFKLQCQTHYLFIDQIYVLNKVLLVTSSTLFLKLTPNEFRCFSESSPLKKN